MVQLSGRLVLERKIAALSRPHGVIARRQLLSAGIGANLIDGLIAARWLRPMHRGVYAVGPVQSQDAAEMAALLACGERAVLSHRSAAALWRLLSKRPHDPVEVTVASRHSRRRPRITVRRAPELRRDEVTVVRRVRVTTPARTLLDLAVQHPMRELEQAIAKAERSYAGTRRRLLALLARYPARPGTPKLRELLGDSRRPAFARSEAEERFLALVRRAELPAPEVNVMFGSYEIDFLWREAGLAVEVDGFAFHGDRAAFEADRRRDAGLATRGILVIRLTWRQVAHEPEATLVLLTRALAGRGLGA